MGLVMLLRAVLCSVFLFLCSCAASIPYDSGSQSKQAVHSAKDDAKHDKLNVKAKKQDDRNYDQLWLGALASLSFMEIRTEDKESGIITTAWYEGSANPGERFMVTVVVLRGLKSSPQAYRVKVKKETLKDKRWVDEVVDPRLGYEIAHKMYNRSKKLKEAVRQNQ